MSQLQLDYPNVLAETFPASGSVVPAAAASEGPGESPKRWAFDSARPSFIIAIAAIGALSACGAAEEIDGTLSIAEVVGPAAHTAALAGARAMRCAFGNNPFTTGRCDGFPGADSIRFEIDDDSSPIRLWTVEPRSLIVNKEGCGAFDAFCLVKFNPTCAGSFFQATTRTANAPFNPLEGTTGDTWAATANDLGGACTAATRPECLVPPPIPAFASVDLQCGGRYQFYFHQVPGATRYHAETVQGGFPWELAVPAFDCAAENLATEEFFTHQVPAGTRRLRLNACNACGCSPWSPEVTMKRTVQCL
jgi:hypothetical protein